MVFIAYFWKFRSFNPLRFLFPIVLCTYYHHAQLFFLWYPTLPKLLLICEADRVYFLGLACLLYDFDTSKFLNVFLTYSSLLRIHAHGSSGPVFYYTRILFSHLWLSPDFVLQKKREFLCLVASRVKFSIMASVKTYRWRHKQMFCSWFH